MLTTDQQKSRLDGEQINHLMPTILQHAVSGGILMMGYINQQVLTTTVQTGKVTFFSCTKLRLWAKGECSGRFLNTVDTYPDCDNDTLLILVSLDGPNCQHENSSYSSTATSNWGFLDHLKQLLAERKTANPKSTYTAGLYASNTKRFAQKVREAGIETALAATVNDSEELTNETSNLLYHLIVLLQDQDLDLSKAIGRLREKYQK